MAGLTRSYVHGASDVPLIGQTIGEYLDATVARLPEAEALVVRHQKVRWTYRELQQRVDAFAAGLLALGLEPGDRVGIWSPNNAEWVVTQFATAKAGLILVNINPAYRLAELEYALNKVGCKALITATAFKTSDYVAHAAPAGARAGTAHAGRAACRAAAGPAHRRSSSAPQQRRACCASTRSAGLAATAERTDALASSRRSAAVRRPDQHPVHQRHHGLPQGRDAHPPQHPEQRLLRRRGDAAHRARPPVHSGAALSLLRHGARATWPASRTARPWSIPARASIRWPCWRRSQAERCTGAAWRADHVHRRARITPSSRASTLSSLRTGIMAGSPCPIEVMKRVDQRDAHGARSRSPTA